MPKDITTGDKSTVQRQVLIRSLDFDRFGHPGVALSAKSPALPFFTFLAALGLLPTFADNDDISPARVLVGLASLVPVQAFLAGGAAVSDNM